MKKTIIAFVFLLSFASCNRYLDIKPYGQTIPETAEEFSALLHAQLDEIDYGEETVIGDGSTVADLECYADNLAANLTQYPGGGYIPLYIGENLSAKQTMYMNLYEVIRNCNIIIGNLEERDSRLGMDVLGTAYILRGICYYDLLRNFCQACNPDNPGPGVPLVTEFDMEAKPTRSTYARTVERIEEDLNKAIEYDIQDKIYRFNSDVAKGYLARLYFWTQQYELAAQYASELLEKYPLLDPEPYKKMMGEQLTKSGNMIFKAQIYAGTSESTALTSLKGYMKNRPCSRQFYDLFAEKDRDVRFAISMDSKRLAVKNLLSCLRSAELQLILAESYYHCDEPEKALAALNELRRRRITDVTPYTVQTLPAVNPADLIQTDAKGNALTPLLYAILCERRKELFFEGDRWYELKRNGCPEFWVAKQGLKFTVYSWMYTFPLYAPDIQLVEGLEQNPGYDRME